MKTDPSNMRPSWTVTNRPTIFSDPESTMKIKASTSNIKWDRPNRSVTDDEVADVLANGHPKSNPPSIPETAAVLPGSPGSGAAPGANGPPTTGGISPGGPLGST